MSARPPTPTNIHSHTAGKLTASQQTVSLSLRDLDAILFDLDGVVTKTADLHAAAWKQMFDAYLQTRANQTAEPFQPFDIVADYQQYVDGKPRYDGVRSFLTARGITLPEGSPDDPPERETICGLGNAKQKVFLEQLATRGVEVYESSVAFIQQAKAQGLKVAVITSSKNGTTVLETAGLTDLFDTAVDGRERERLGLAGKPHADTFLEATKRLGVQPSRTAMVEDAIVGVQAGRAGGFAWVIGLDRHGRAQELQANGAHLVVPDLAALTLQPSSSASLLPSALEHLDEVAALARTKRIVVFLDYDGTLTPIVERPEDAHLSAAMQTVLSNLARSFTVAIVSGRGLADVRQRVGLEALYYAGSHGFEMVGPDGFEAIYEPAQAFLPALDQAEQALHDRLDSIPGAQIERKHFALAIHYRRVHEAEVEHVAAAVKAVQAIHTQLRQTGGKKVCELRPDLDWHKGTALFWLLEAMHLDRNGVLPIYIGDDVTDEDAFVAVHTIGIGIIVTDGSTSTTAARYVLADTDAVRAFLQALALTHKQEQTS
jgi:alpha,alpha-trehalase